MDTSHMDMDGSNPLFAAAPELFHPGSGFFGGNSAEHAASAALSDAFSDQHLLSFSQASFSSGSHMMPVSAAPGPGDLAEFGFTHAAGYQSPQHLGMASLSLHSPHPLSNSSSPVPVSSMHNGLSAIPTLNFPPQHHYHHHQPQALLSPTSGGPASWSADVSGNLSGNVSPQISLHSPLSGLGPSSAHLMMQRSTSTPSSHASSRAASPGVHLERQMSEDLGNGHTRSVSSPAITLRAAIRSRHSSFGSAQKSPLRAQAGFPSGQQSRASPSLGNSPLPSGDDRDDDDSSAPGSPSMRRAHDSEGSFDAEPASIKRVRNSSINRSSSLPLSAKKPPLSPVTSPRVSRRSSRVADSDRDSPLPGRSSPAAAAASAMPSTSGGPGLEGILRLVVQPSQFGRFRYEAEGRQNCVEGEEKGTFPTVEIAPEWAPLCPDGTYVNVSLVRRDDFRVHHHILSSKDGGQTQQPLINRRATFSNLVVKRQRSEIRYPSEDQRAVRLLFTVSFPRDGVITQAYAVSQPVFNAELKINRVSHKAGPMAAYTDVMLFCSKVQKKSVGILITDNKHLGGIMPDSADAWMVTPEGAHVFLVQHGIDVHHQYGLAFKFPPYFDQSHAAEGVSANVFFQLVDTSDGIASDFESWTYISHSYDTNI
eukprot:m.70222 g.70222  ORF g.70222 m.70222 type:complete len:650 (-) comp12880_c1_seq4:238-2187(-)